MPLAVQFTEGSLAGRRFPVGSDPVLVGRSHVCAIRPGEPDVSGRHVVLSAAGETLSMEVLSARRTKAAGSAAVQGSVLALAPGTTVELGSSLAFRVVRDDDGKDETPVEPADPATETPVPDGENGDADGPDGETQVLQTQMVSPDELRQLRDLHKKKTANKLAGRIVLAAIAFGAAIGLSAALSGREPEKTFTKGSAPWASRVLYEGRGAAPGRFGIAWPTNAAPAAAKPRGDGSWTVETRIGRDGATALRLFADTFEDAKAIGESRAATFQRHLENGRDLAGSLDGMIELPEEDFFGGANGLHRGVPCSRREYWRLDANGVSWWGVVSFFRCGTLCCAVRREVEAPERDRAKNLLEPTRNFVWADAAGVFADAQWEGADGAGCRDPGAELRRCAERLAVESPAEWPALETRLRNVLAAVSRPDAGAEAEEIRKSALGELAKLRGRKALAWKRISAHRTSIEMRSGKADEAEAKKVDALVRKTFPDPSEQWGSLALRRIWWK